MARLRDLCVGLLKAGALALVLMLLGAGTASAMEAHHAHHVTHAPSAAPCAEMMTDRVDPASLLVANDMDCHRRQQATDGVDKVADGGTTEPCDCPEGCACGCAQACAAHLLTGLPVLAAAVPQPPPSGLLMPTRDDAGLGCRPEPGLRPPLSI